MIVDQFGRQHTYLRIALTEQCNLRCFYCMPEEGVCTSNSSAIMTADEIIKIANTFVELGIEKIRLTGGEPLVRQDFDRIVRSLSVLPVKLALTTNGVLVERYLDVLKECKVKNINISMDTLKKEKFFSITKRDQFDRVFKNVQLCVEVGIPVKINVVLIKGVNDDEIVDFLRLTKEMPVTIQFIEYMPFSGNKWQKDQCITLSEILNIVTETFGIDTVFKKVDDFNSTSKGYEIKNHEGSFSVISTVSNPFCDSCNRIRLTANGKLKNCLFSQSETDLLTPLRLGENIKKVIEVAMYSKFKSRGGFDSFNSQGKDIKEKNRSMILIGG